MSQQHADVWNQAASTFSRGWEQVQGEQWQAQSVCSDWNVQQLCDHTVETQLGFAAAMVGAEVPEGAAWPEIQAAIGSRLEDPSVLEGMTEHPAFGTVPKAMLFGIASSDLLIHSWDLARSIGADEQLPAEAVAACYGGLQMLPEEVRLAEGRFAAPVACAEDADQQTQFLSFSGRQV